MRIIHKQTRLGERGEWVMQYCNWHLAELCSLWLMQLDAKLQATECVCVCVREEGEKKWGKVEQ